MDEGLVGLWLCRGRPPVHNDLISSEGPLRSRERDLGRGVLDYSMAPWRLNFWGGAGLGSK